VEVEEHAAVVGDGRGDDHLQQHVLELDARGRHATGGGRLDGHVADFLALADDRLALVAGDHARVGDDLATALLLHGRQLDVEQVAGVEDRQRQRAGRVGDGQVAHQATLDGGDVGIRVVDRIQV